MTTHINRRTALAAVAAVPAAAALAVPALAELGVDAELRQLWTKYLVQLAAHDKVHAVVTARRDAFDAVCPKTESGVGDFHNPDYKALWKKHGLDAL